MSHFRLPENASVHKDWIHATGPPVDNLPSKMENLRNFRTAMPRNKQNMFIANFLSFFKTYFANFIYSELPSSTQAEGYSEPH